MGKAPQRAAARRAVSISTLVCACAGLVLWALCRVDAGAASGLARLSGVVAFVWLALRMQGEPGLRGRGIRQVPFALVALAAIALVAGLISALFSRLPSNDMFLGWTVAFCLDAILVAVCVQTLRDGGVLSTPALPWCPLLLIAALCLVPAFFLPRASWGSCFLVPAAVCLSLEPLAIWHATLRALANARRGPGSGRAHGHGAMLVLQAVLSAFALAVSLALLANAGTLPLASPAGLVFGSALFAVVMALTAGTTLHAIDKAAGHDMRARQSAERELGQRASKPDILQTESSRADGNALPAEATAGTAASPRRSLKEATSTRQPITPKVQIDSIEEGRAAFALRNHLGCEELGARYDLSKRQQAVLERIANGMSRADIATDLVLSRNTVNSHAREAYRKMEIHSRDDLLAKIELVTGA